MWHKYEMCFEAHLLTALILNTRSKCFVAKFFETFYNGNRQI